MKPICSRLKHFFFSLRFRLILLVLLTSIPAGMLVVYTSARERQSLSEAARREVLNLAVLASARQDWLTESTHQLLAGLSHFPQVKEGDAEACSTLFSNLHADYPLYADLVVVHPNGDRWCHALPNGEPVNYADRTWFQQAMETRIFVAGGYVLGRATRRPLATYAYPLLDETGAVQSVVGAGLDLAWLNAYFADLPLPENAVLTFFDGQGTVLARSLEAEQWVGQSAPEAEVVQAVLESSSQETLEAAGVDGVRRLYAHAPLSGAAEHIQHIVVGIPTALVYAEADRALRGNLTTLGVVTLLALVATWGGGEAFIFRRVNALIAATQRMAQGDLRARSGITHGTSEIRQLARAFDEMAEALEQEARQRELASQTIRLQVAALEAAANAIIITDRQGTIEWVNPAWVSLTGYRPKEAIGQNPRILNSGRQEETFYSQLWETILAGEVWRSEFVNRRKDGSLYTEEETITPLLDTSGRVTHFIAIKQDITERVRAEEVLQESEEKYRAVAESSPDAIILANIEGMIVTWNYAAERIFQYTEAEVLGRSLSLLIPERCRSQHEAGLRELGAGRESRLIGKSIELHGLRKDGQEFPLELSLGVWETKQGRFYSGIIRDITWRKRREQELVALREVAVAGTEAKNVDELIERATQIIGEMLYPDHFGLLLVDEQEGALRIHPAYQGLPEKDQGRLIPLGSGITGRVVAAGRALRISDVTQEADYIETTPGMRSELCVPLTAGEQVIGVVNAESAQIDAFTQADERLLGTFAGQLATALEKLRLFKQATKRLRELETLQRVTIAVSAAFSLDEALEHVVAILASELGYQHIGIALVDEPRQRLELRVEAGIPVTEWGAAGQGILVGQGLVGWVAQHGEPLLVGDVTRDPRYLAGIHETRAELVVPLQAGGRVTGVINAESPQVDAFDAEDLRLLNTLAGQLSTIIERTRLFDETRRQAEELSGLAQVSSTLRQAENLEALRPVILQASLDVMGAQAGSFFLLDERTNELYMAAYQGYPVDVAGLRLKMGEGVAGECALSGQPIFIADIAADARIVTRQALAGLHKALCVPLKSGEELAGVLLISFTAHGAPTSAEIDLLTAIADMAGNALHRAALHEQTLQDAIELAVAYDSTLEGWAKALELRDQETEGHTRRVTKMTVRLARALGIAEAELEHIRRGALLHDIGKMGIPDSILLKPGLLDEAEWVLMRQHPVYACNMLAPIDFLRPALDIPYCHHEKWDGSGYPRGLKGEEIPLTARVFAVVDVYDALTSDRPYRKAWPRQKALTYIKEQSGKHYDPQVAVVFLEMIEK